MEIPASITEQIENIKDTEISYRTLHSVGNILDASTKNNIIIPYISILSKYRHFLKKYTINVRMDDVLCRKYVYNPKLLSYDIYGTTELWAELLRINNCSSTIEFKFRKVKIYDPTKLKDIINEIMILEGVIT